MATDLAGVDSISGNVRIKVYFLNGGLVRREELIEAIHTAPFRPFRLCISDGRTFDIRHPEMLMVGRHSASVGVPGARGPEETILAYPEIDRFALVDLLHVTGIEALPQPQRQEG
jgi:hypothetical protein